MKKAECEKAIRCLCQVWANEQALPLTPEGPDFGSFYGWLRSRAPEYLEYPNDDAPIHQTQVPT